MDEIEQKRVEKESNILFSILYKQELSRRKENVCRDFGLSG